jgi:hypothetical protein
VQELLEWFMEIYLIERVPAKHEQKDYKLDSVKRTLESYEYAANAQGILARI